MSEKNIKTVEEYMRRWYKRTANHILEDDMDLDQAMQVAAGETSDDLIFDVENEFMQQVFKMIFKK